MTDNNFMFLLSKLPRANKFYSLAKKKMELLLDFEIGIDSVITDINNNYGDVLKIDLKDYKSIKKKIIYLYLLDMFISVSGFEPYKEEILKSYINNEMFSNKQNTDFKALEDFLKNVKR